MKTGIHDISFAEYHALDAWSSSALRAMRRGPPARVLYEMKHPREATDATIVGSLVHCTLITPDLFESAYAVKPDGMTFASLEGKTWRDAHEQAGKTIVKFADAARAEVIRQHLLEKRAVSAALSRATHRETSLIWRCSMSGELCKARPDWIADGYIYDLKVSRHAGSEYLSLRAFSDGWMHQLAHYRTGAVELGLDVRGGRLVVVAPFPPHFVYLLEVKRDALDLLEIENIQTVKELRECRKANSWPGTLDSWKKIEPPVSAGMAEMNGVVLGEEETEEAEQAQESQYG